MNDVPEPAGALMGRDDISLGVSRTVGDVVGLTQQLIRSPSPNPPGGETAAAGVVQHYLADLEGVQRTRVEAVPGRVNDLYATGPPDAPGLLFTAHLDTVPIDGTWTVEPYGGELVDDRVFGRGATDNKGAVAALAGAFRVLHGLGLADRRILFLVNADEEAGGHAGIDAVLAELDLDVEAAVVAEPSGVVESFEALWIAARGASRFRIEVTGTHMHSSLADRLDGTNAIEGLIRLEQELRSRLPILRRRHPEFGSQALLVPVALDTDGHWGTTPSKAEIMFDLRLAPGVGREQVEAELREALVASSAVVGVETMLTFAPGSLDWIEPSDIAVDHPLVEATVAAWAEVVGRPPELGCFPGGTDARALTTRGIEALPGLGPGCLARAHAPDEYVTADELATALRLYVSLAIRYLDGLGR